MFESGGNNLLLNDNILIPAIYVTVRMKPATENATLNVNEPGHGQLTV
jgi:hypothetical protein